MEGKNETATPTNNPSIMPTVRDTITIANHLRLAISLIIKRPIIPPIPPAIPPIRTLSKPNGSLLTRRIVEVAIIATTVAPIRLPYSESKRSLTLDTLLVCSVAVTMGNFDISQYQLTIDLRYQLLAEAYFQDEGDSLKKNEALPGRSACFPQREEESLLGV